MTNVNRSTPAALLPRAVVCIALCLVIAACSRGGTAVIGSRAAAGVRPGPRSGHNLVFDPVAGHTLLLFGYTGATLPARPEILAWRDGAWSILDRHGPGFRSLAGVDVDSAGRRLLLFGGAGPGYRSRYGDLWTWDGAWTETVAPTGPGPLDHHTAAYDQERRTLIVFGGNTPSGAWPRATWAFDSAGWRIVGDSSSGPPGRAHHAMVYDASRGRIVMFGGLGTDRSYMNDTWEWNGTRWHRVATGGPPVRARHRLAYDVRRRVVVLYGGTGERPPGQTTGFNVVSDTWEYDGRGWRSVGDAVGPGPRMGHAMTYDASVGETLLFGGSDGAKILDDLWSWNGRRWTRR
jgi:hypothetical protein